ncbi:MAG: metallophosphoesterase [Geminicoccaceae bacterium]|nr:metallophosphoesterase [Geminicoccaceae bacterium]
MILEPRSNRRAAAIVERINGDGFELALHLGDVVHPLPSMASAEAAWQAADAILGRLRMPLAVILGNHDIGDKSCRGCRRSRCAPIGSRASRRVSARRAAPSTTDRSASSCSTPLAQ